MTNKRSLRTIKMIPVIALLLGVVFVLGMSSFTKDEVLVDKAAVSGTMYVSLQPPLTVNSSNVTQVTIPTNLIGFNNSGSLHCKITNDLGTSYYVYSSTDGVNFAPLYADGSW